MKNGYKYFVLIGVAFIFMYLYTTISNISVFGYKGLLKLIAVVALCIIFGILTAVIIQWELPKRLSSSLKLIALFFLSIVVIWIISYEIMLKRFYYPFMRVTDLFILQYINALYWSFKLIQDEKKEVQNEN